MCFVELRSEKFQYILQISRSNPSELLRLGRVGIASFCYRYLHRCTGKNTVVGERTVMINSANIHIGDDCLIQDRVYFRAGVDGHIRIGNGVAVNSHVQMYGHGDVDLE